MQRLIIEAVTTLQQHNKITSKANIRRHIESENKLELVSQAYHLSLTECVNKHLLKKTDDNQYYTQ